MTRIVKRSEIDNALLHYLGNELLLFRKTRRDSFSLYELVLLEQATELIIKALESARKRDAIVEEY